MLKEILQDLGKCQHMESQISQQEYKAAKVIDVHKYKIFSLS